MKYLVILVLYFLVFIVAWFDKRKLDGSERKTFLMLFLVWSVTIFIANYLGYKMGILSFMPWVNNFLHAFVWIGVCLSYMFLALRKQHIITQFMAYASFSLVIRYTEYKIFGVWEHDNCLNAVQGTDAYIIGWSFIDGGYGIVTILLLKLLSKKIRGLV